MGTQKQIQASSNQSDPQQQQQHDKKSLESSRKMSSQSESSASSIMRLNWSSARRHLSILMIAALIVLLGRASAEHALSEVWSEADGLQMKYSTDHDDLLSTKGSELSLQTHGAPSKHEAGESQAASQEEAAGGSKHEDGESAAASSGGMSPPEAETGGSSSGESSSESQENGETGGSSDSDQSSAMGAHQSSGEQGADSRRQTDRVPPNKQYLSAKQQAFSEPPSRYRNSESSSGSDSMNDEVPERGASHGRSAKTRQSLFSTTDETPASFESVQASTDESSSETANVDHGDDSDAPLGESPNPKFRAPGRLFKEAVRMSSPADRQPAKGDEEAGSNQDDADESSSASLKQQNQQESSANNEEAPSSPVAAGEPDFLLGGEKQPAHAFRSRQKMIDFDNLVDNKQKSSAAASAGSTASNNNNNEDPDEVANVDNEERSGQEFGSQNDGSRRTNLRGRPESNSPFLRPDSFFDQSNQRAMAAGSSPAQKERAAPAKQSRYLPSAATASQASGPPKQLAYLRSVSGDQQQQGRRFVASVSAAAPAESESPDNVRDNFISPGHYPGSMPHLTQAASELQKQQLAGRASSVSSVEPKASDLTISASSASPASISGSSQLEAAQQVASASVVADQAAGGRMTGMLQQVTVTPEPEAQPESQQIMAPILMSTTTMAPMASTSAPASGDLTSTSSTTSTTAPPTLERFKFRKYR